MTGTSVAYPTNPSLRIFFNLLSLRVSHQSCNTNSVVALPLKQIKHHQDASGMKRNAGEVKLRGRAGVFLRKDESRVMYALLRMTHGTMNKKGN